MAEVVRLVNVGETNGGSLAGLRRLAGSECWLIDSDAHTFTLTHTVLYTNTLVFTRRERADGRASTLCDFPGVANRQLPAAGWY